MENVNEIDLVLKDFFSVESGVWLDVEIKLEKEIVIGNFFVIFVDVGVLSYIEVFKDIDLWVVKLLEILKILEVIYDSFC